MANNGNTYHTADRDAWASEVIPLRPAGTAEQAAWNGSSPGAASNTARATVPYTGGNRQGMGMASGMTGTQRTGTASSGMAAQGRAMPSASDGLAPDWTTSQDAWNALEERVEESWPNLENDLPDDVIEAPTTMEEVYRGSMKALLLRNVGNYVVATFLIGTQTTVSWEGILYDVGNDYLAIYQSGRDQYIVSDLYSLKYVEFYDTRRREMCEALMNGQAGN